MKYSIIVPCYNESGNIAKLVACLEQMPLNLEMEFILVENGSKDDTRQVLHRECAGKDRFKIVYVDKNRGYGYGLICGMKEATGDYVGWLHADLQVSPDDMLRFVNYAAENGKDARLFLKGNRKNRSLIECFFTGGMSVYATLVLRCYLHDIGALPVLFHRSLLTTTLSTAPYDFSIETYMYYMAKKMGMLIKRFDVTMHLREKGASSWNNGMKAKLRQSKIIAKDIIKIKRGISIR